MLNWVGPVTNLTGTQNPTGLWVQVWNWICGCRCESNFSPKSLLLWIRFLLHPIRTWSITIPSRGERSRLLGKRAWARLVSVFLLRFKWAWKSWTGLDRARPLFAFRLFASRGSSHEGSVLTPKERTRDRGIRDLPLLVVSWRVAMRSAACRHVAGSLKLLSGVNVSGSRKRWHLVTCVWDPVKVVRLLPWVVSPLQQSIIRSTQTLDATRSTVAGALGSSTRTPCRSSVTRQRVGDSCSREREGTRYTGSCFWRHRRSKKEKKTWTLNRRTACCPVIAKARLGGGGRTAAGTEDFQSAAPT
jgi:hypothetical protein